MRATLLKPGIILFVQPGADFAQLASKTFALSLDHFAHPATWSDGSDGEFDEGIGRQGRTVVYVVLTRCCDVGRIHHPGGCLSGYHK